MLKRVYSSSATMNCSERHITVPTAVNCLCFVQDESLLSTHQLLAACMHVEQEQLQLCYVLLGRLTHCRTYRCIF